MPHREQSMPRITSRQHPAVAMFRGAAREAGPRILLDGVHLVQAALDARVTIEVAAVQSEDTSATVADRAVPSREEIQALSSRLSAGGARVLAVTRGVMDAMSPVRSPSGIVALAARPVSRPDDLLIPPPALVVVLAGIQDPGNVGAILRVADAGGATGAIALPGTADPFGWKALRGSMGSALHLPVWEHAGWEETRAWLRDHGCRTYAATPRAPRSLYDIDWSIASAVLFGAEGHGVHDDIAAAVDDTFSIPMRPHVESLNVATGAALVVYEARRRRELRPPRL